MVFSSRILMCICVYIQTCVSTYKHVYMFYIFFFLQVLYSLFSKTYEFNFSFRALQKDGRKAERNGFKWSLNAHVESLAWESHTEHSFVVCLLI